MKSYLSTIYYATFALFVFLCHILWKRRTCSKTSQAAPEPAGAWPFIGHLPMLFAPNVAHITLGELADKYGPAFMVRLGLSKALVVSSSEVAKECFTTNDRALATRPTSVAVKIMGYDYGLFSFARYGPYWREVHKIAILELLSSHRLELLKHVRMSEVSTSVNDLYKIWQASHNDGNQSVLVEMKQWFSHLTLNVIVRMIAGKRYVSAYDCEGTRLQKGIQDFFRLVGIFVLADAIPCLGWLDFQGHDKDMKRTAKELDNILARWFEEHKQKLAYGQKDEEDFMYVLYKFDCRR